MEKRSDRRSSERFTARDTVFAVLRPHKEILGQNIDIVGQVMNLGMHGLALSYWADQESRPDCRHLDIVAADSGFCLAGIPFETVWDRPFREESEPPSQNDRKRGLRFGKLTSPQRDNLRVLIGNYTRPDPETGGHPVPVADMSLPEAESGMELQPGLFT